MDFRSPEGPSRYAALLDVADGVVVGLDFDGTLAPIVEDPAAAVIHPDAADVLVPLAARVRAVAVVTGRPARQVVELGDLDRLADRLSGGRLLVMGQYGNERWDSETRRFQSPAPPEALEALREELPGILEAADASGAHVEEKGLAIAVHTRRLDDAQPAYARLQPVLADAADRHGLALEPGRLVLEVRAPGMHKGEAVRTLVEELRVDGLVFAGDDLGDVEAFEAVGRLRDRRLPALLVCSGSEEQQALVELVRPGGARPGGRARPAASAHRGRRPGPPRPGRWVAAVVEAGEPLEQVPARRVAAAQPRPGRGHDVQREHRQPQAHGVLAGVPLLVTQQPRARLEPPRSTAADDHVAHRERRGDRQPGPVAVREQQAARSRSDPGTAQDRDRDPEGRGAVGRVGEPHHLPGLHAGILPHPGRSGSGRPRLECWSRCAHRETAP